MFSIKPNNYLTWAFISSRVILVFFCFFFTSEIKQKKTLNNKKGFINFIAQSVMMWYYWENNV